MTNWIAEKHWLVIVMLVWKKYELYKYIIH